MAHAIRSVLLVSDGMVVDFNDGTGCYFPAAFLLQHAGQGCNHKFLDYDPSPVADARGMGELAGVRAGVDAPQAHPVSL